MIESTQKIEIKDILFLTENNEITLTGTVNRNLLSYETHMLLDSTQLNLVINQLQRINPNFEVSELFQSRTSENGNIVFYFDACELDNSTLEVESFAQNQVILQIRA